MNPSFDIIYKDAINLLHRLTTPHGILASTIEADNYKRIWARDSIVCGLAGLMIDDELLIEGLKNSLLTLAQHQNDLGMIPSNVLPGTTSDVSYGSLVGRIDAHTWFVVGCCNYFLKTNDAETWSQLQPALGKCREYLRTAEFNNKGWIYTPLSGNWADEYPVHGYTLYDNTLRLWGESLWQQITGESISNIDEIRERTRANFWPSSDISEKNIYHKASFDTLDLDAIHHFIAFILPGKYDLRFDAAGNALALLQNELNSSQKSAISKFISMLTSEISKPLIPAFWPVIEPISHDWNLMETNYSFDFKNSPGNFHNGGIWPVWMGLFSYGLAKNGLVKEARAIISAFTETVSENQKWDFQEYFNAMDLTLGGKTQMGYTASGVVFMKLALLGRF